MRMFNQKYVSLLICSIFCFTCLEHGSGNGSHVEGLVPLGNKGSIVRENNQSLASNEGSGSSFNVKDYGAIGDGTTDDSAAFLAAFGKACQIPFGVMLVPSGSKFLLQSITFDGSSCQQNITFQIEGNVVAPLHKSDWKNPNAEDWILFDKFANGIKVTGNGVLDGSGKDWWPSQKSGQAFYNISNCFSLEDVGGSHPPSIIRFRNCDQVTLAGITVQNSPWFHINILQCTRVMMSGLTVSSPGDSPNTDGIHISNSQHIYIQNSNIGAGDDCVSIQNLSTDVEIHNVHCGPGHGFSVGSLGECNSNAQVSQIYVYDSFVTQAMNGVRIKTWEGGSGTVSDVKFINVHMDRVTNPVVIDQHYCTDTSGCGSTGASDIEISSVLFQNITGTYTYMPVSIRCSEDKPCRDITINTIQLTPSGIAPVDPICDHAYGRVLSSTTPPLGSCLI